MIRSFDLVTEICLAICGKIVGRRKQLWKNDIMCHDSAYFCALRHQKLALSVLVMAVTDSRLSRVDLQEIVGPFSEQQNCCKDVFFTHTTTKITTNRYSAYGKQATIEYSFMQTTAPKNYSVLTMSLRCRRTFRSSSVNISLREVCL